MLECHLTTEQALPLVCLCSLLSFLTGVGIGGNDLSANFAMVVGSGSLNMKQAIIYCVVFELLGALFMGGKVSNTIRNGIVNPILFDRSADMVVGGMTCATFSSALWLFLSTQFGLPVSITHTVVGSVLGFAIFSVGSFEYVLFGGIKKIIVSWLLAPVLAAIVTALFFSFLRSKVLGAKGSFARAERALPYLMAFSLFVDLCFIFIEQPPVLNNTFALLMPQPMQFSLLTILIGMFSYWANLYLFPSTVAEAKGLSHFCWEAEVVTTRAMEDDETDPAETRSEASQPSTTLSHFALLREGTLDALVKSEGGFGPTRERGAETETNSATSHNAPAAIYRASSFSASDAKIVSRGSAVKIVSNSSGAAAKRVSFNQAPMVDATSATTILHHNRTTYGTLDTDEVSFGDSGEMDVGDEIAKHMNPIRYGGILVAHFNPRAEYLFTVLQVFAGAMSSFVHGAVAGANATATFMILYETFSRHYLSIDASSTSSDPLNSQWAILPAMLGITIGMCSLGARLMKTVGMDLVTVTPARGWTMQVGGTLVTMVCTGLGIPVSLSQCQVGAAIGCGVTDAGGTMAGVSWSVVFKIIAGWVVTLVIGSCTTGLTMRVLAHFYCGMQFYH